MGRGLSKSELLSMRRGKILSYDELLSQYPDWTLWETETYAQESTPEATERAHLHRVALIGHMVSPSIERAPAHFAYFRPPLVSNVRQFQFIYNLLKT